MDWKKFFVLLCFLGMPISGRSATTSENVDSSDLKNDQANMFQRVKRSFENPTSTKWTVYHEDQIYTIPYVIEDVTDVDHSQKILEAFQDYHHFTCIRFRPRRTEERYITIRLVTENMKYDYGMTISQCGRHVHGEDDVTINTDCENMIYHLRHELYHLLGFFYEHERPDAGEYLNLDDTQVYTAERKRIQSVDITPFDIYSISLNNKLRSRETNQLLGKGYGRLSYFDIKNINKVYTCRDKLLFSGCSGSFLPRVIGAGHLSSNKKIYEQREAVHIICDEGYEPVDTQFSYCTNGKFWPRQLECRKIACEDYREDCDQLMPRVCVTFHKKYCLRTCGLCGSLCYSTPPITTLGYISVPHYHKDYYFPNESVTFKCPLGYIPLKQDHATCMGATGWDLKEFQCIKKTRLYTREFYGNLDQNSKCKREELPKVAHGRYEPDMKIYDREDVIQLVCEDGYEPASSSTVYCKKFNVDGEEFDGFDFTHLECIKRKCENSRFMDLMHRTNQLKDKCTQPKNIGFVRKSAKKACELCGACKSTPIFDRHLSYLTPMKMEYQEGENVTINCINGYHPNIATAECREGEFNPPRLTCVADETSCTGLPPLDYQLRHISPVLEVYPNGFEVELECHTSNPITFQYLQLTIRCVDGEWEDYSC